MVYAFVHCSTSLGFYLSRTRNEEPLVNRFVNWSIGLSRSSWDGPSNRSRESWDILQSGGSQGNTLVIYRLTFNQLLPGFMSLLDNIQAVLLVLSFTRESKLVFWFTIWNLVNSEPFISSLQ